MILRHCQGMEYTTRVGGFEAGIQAVVSFALSGLRDPEAEVV